MSIIMWGNNSPKGEKEKTNNCKVLSIVPGYLYINKQTSALKNN